MEDLDEKYMRRCLQLAACGLGRVRPNPLVGCVVVGEVDGGKWSVVSEGYHQEYGHNHAERNALLRVRSAEFGVRSCESGVRSSLDKVADHSSPFTSHLLPFTLYVNLEPCSHYGKTPPCADLIIEKGIRRVVCCNDDPNPLVAGGGFRKLEAAGIEVKRHVLEDEGRELNRRFFTFMEQHRPYVILKWAESADGYMAPEGERLKVKGERLKVKGERLEVKGERLEVKGERYWLSTLEQNRINHRWRTEEAAILVGSETYLQDHPSLTARHYLGPQPTPVVVDRRGRLNDVPSHWLHLRTATVEETLAALYERKIQSVIVEGGRQVLDAFIASGLYDEVRILRGPNELGGGLKAPAIPPVAEGRLTVVEP